MALAGPQQRCIITAKSSEKCQIWPPALAARLTPHSAVTPCGDESLNIFIKICFSPRTDLGLSRPIKIVIEVVSRCCSTTRLRAPVGTRVQKVRHLSDCWTWAQMMKICCFDLEIRVIMLPRNIKHADRHNFESHRSKSCRVWPCSASPRSQISLAKI